MKLLSHTSLFCVVVISLVAGCSDSAAPASGGAMMNDDAMAGDAMMKEEMKGGGMMEGDMKGDGMTKDESK